MKTLCYFFLFSVFCFSSVAADKNFSDEISDWDYDLELDVDIDFCCEKKITAGIRALVDMAWSVVGCDSKAFIETKNFLKDPQSRIELILATLVISKYPDEIESYGGVKLLMNEIELIGGRGDFEFLKNQIDKISSGQKMKRIFNLVKKLHKTEQLSIMNNLLMQEPLIGCENQFSIIENERFKNYFQPLLKTCVKA